MKNIIYILLFFAACTPPIECDYSHLIIEDGISYCIDSIGITDTLASDHHGPVDVGVWDFKTYTDTIRSYGRIQLNDTGLISNQIIKYIK